jgi:hypothetical protein
MAESKTKEERRRAAAEAGKADPGPAEGKREKARRKAERQKARAGRKDRAGAAEQAGARLADQHEMERRLARIEDAVATQAERSEELISKLDEVLQEARKPAGDARSAVEQPAE